MQNMKRRIQPAFLIGGIPREFGIRFPGFGCAIEIPAHNALLAHVKIGRGQIRFGQLDRLQSAIFHAPHVRRRHFAPLPEKSQRRHRVRVRDANAHIRAGNTASTRRALLHALREFGRNTAKIQRQNHRRGPALAKKQRTRLGALAYPSDDTFLAFGFMKPRQLDSERRGDLDSAFAGFKHEAVSSRFACSINSNLFSS
jgi:hypothetical protein